VILGPTAGGKSALGVVLAQWLTGEIISADSMQVYRHLDAGTAKPSPAVRQRVAHHLLDCVDPTQRFTVADWLLRAREAMSSMQKRGIRPIIAGGTNLYIKALMAGLFDSPAIDQTLRKSLANVPGRELHLRLGQVDPDAALRIHPNDRKRLVRALEVFHVTGKPISSLQTQWQNSPGSTGRSPGTQPPNAEPPCPERGPSRFCTIGLEWPVSEINRRINLRVKGMFYPDNARQQDGLRIWEPRSLPEEVRDLASQNLLGFQAREALGYKQVLEHLAGRFTLEEAFEKTKIATRRFAKQQRTWLRRYQGVHWLSASHRGTDSLAAEALQVISRA